MDGVSMVFPSIGARVHLFNTYGVPERSCELTIKSKNPNEKNT